MMRTLTLILALAAPVLAPAQSPPAPFARPGPPVWTGASVSLAEKGAKCDGVTDDTRAIQAWLDAAAPHARLVAPAGVCVFAAPLSAPGGGLDSVGIAGAGPYQTVFRYQGGATEADLLTIGDGLRPYTNWFLSGFTITSATPMAGGSAIHFRKLARSQILDVIWDGQDGTGNLHDGAWFDQVDEVFVTQFEARARHDAIRVNGAVGLGPKAGLFLLQGKISGSGVGIHLGGGFGGLATTQTDVIANGTNLLIDTALAAEGNREAFFDATTNMDTATGGDSIVVNDALTASATLEFDNWLATGPGAGLDIIACRSCKVSVGAPVIWHFKGDGIELRDPTVVLAIGGQTLIHDNGGFGVNVTTPPTTGGVSPGAVPFANRAGAYSADAQVQALAPSAGYQKLAGGMIHEWGSATFTGPAGAILAPAQGNPVALPLPCPSAIIASSVRTAADGFANGAAQMTTTGTPHATTGVNLALDSSAPVTAPQTVTYDLWCY